MGRMKDTLGDELAGQLEFDIKGMVRVPDHSTSIDAAIGVNEIKTKLQARVFELLCARALTDGQLETLPEFSHYRYSTVRKRRSELLQKNMIHWTGERRQGQKVWKAVGK